MRDRDNKIFRCNNYYHVFNRGNNKENIFLDQQDYSVFLNRLELVLGLNNETSTQGVPLGNFDKRRRVRIVPLQPGSFDIISYCLMSNHFHFFIKQTSEIGIDKLILKICTSYASYFNRKYQRVGNVFQDTYKAKLVDSDRYAVYLSAYIHNNPSDPIKYPYSSFREYLDLHNKGICSKKFLLEYFKGNVDDYKKFVLGFSDEDEILIKDLVFDE